ncbi:hypothetical protein FS837_007903, partial [Tulasnella sp. UAMH 9824]
MLWGLEGHVGLRSWTARAQRVAPQAPPPLLAAISILHLKQNTQDFSYPLSLYLSSPNPKDILDMANVVARKAGM